MIANNTRGITRIAGIADLHLKTEQVYPLESWLLARKWGSYHVFGLLAEFTIQKQLRILRPLHSVLGPLDDSAWEIQGGGFGYAGASSGTHHFDESSRGAEFDVARFNALV
jgi:hypothetical protein